MDNFRTLDQLSRELEIQKDWLHDAAKAGKIPCILAGNRMIFSASAVRESLASKAGNWTSPLQYTQQKETE